MAGVVSQPFSLAATPSSLSFNATRSYVQRRVANHRWLKYFERMYWDRHSPSIAPLYLKVKNR